MGTEKTKTTEIPNRLINRLLDHVDGIRYLNVGHLIKTIVLDWLDWQDWQKEEILPPGQPSPRWIPAPTRRRPAKKGKAKP